MNNPVLKRLVSGLIGLLLLFYIGNQIYNAGYNGVKAEIAMYANTEDTIQMTGTVIRKKQLLRQSVQGVLTYPLGEGGKIARDGVVAEVYDSAKDATQQRQAAHLSTEIARLQSLSKPGDTYAANPGSLTKQVSQGLKEILTSLQGRDCNTLSSQRDSPLYLMNERQVVTGASKDFSTKIAQLQGQPGVIPTSGGTRMGQIKSPVSGYFVSAADGYESQYDYASVPELSVAGPKAKKKPQALGSDVIGKVCGEFDWYFAAVVSQDDALKLKEGNRVNINLPFAVSKPIPATAAAVNQPNHQGDAAVILQCSYMDTGIASMHDAIVQVQAGIYSGIMVSQKNIHFEKLTKEFTQEDGTKKKVKKEVQGVYVMHGDTIGFVQIIPLMSSGSYVTCKELSDTDLEWKELMTESPIRLYDEVIIEGTDPYDGKVIKRNRTGIHGADA